MKSFKEYLIESKQTYEFKVKVAGDCPKDCATKIKEALSKFKVESCSGGKSAPIQETQADFPTLKNVGVTVFDVCTEYPATSLEVRDLVAEHCNISLSSIKVRNLKEQEELLQQVELKVVFSTLERLNLPQKSEQQRLVLLVTQQTTL